MASTVLFLIAASGFGSAASAWDARDASTITPSVSDLVHLMAAAETDYADIAKQPSAQHSRRMLAVALGRIGPDAAAAIPALEALKSKGDETIRVPAAQALRRIRAKK